MISTYIKITKRAEIGIAIGSLSEANMSVQLRATHVYGNSQCPNRFYDSVKTPGGAFGMFISPPWKNPKVFGVGNSKASLQMGRLSVMDWSSLL